MFRFGSVSAPKKCRFCIPALKRVLQKHIFFVVMSLMMNHALRNFHLQLIHFFRSRIRFKTVSTANLSQGIISARNNYLEVVMPLWQIVALTNWIFSEPKFYCVQLTGLLLSMILDLFLYVLGLHYSYQSLKLILTVVIGINLFFIWGFSATSHRRFNLFTLVSFEVDSKSVKFFWGLIVSWMRIKFICTFPLLTYASPRKFI